MTPIQWQQASDAHESCGTTDGSSGPSNVWFGVSMLMMGVLAGMGLGAFLLRW